MGIERITSERLVSRGADPGHSANLIASWLAEHGGVRVDPGTLMAELCDRLVAAGVPLSRASYGAPTLHPQVWGSQYIWRRDQKGVSEIRHRHGVERSSTYLDSPVRVLHQGAAAMIAVQEEAMGEQIEFTGPELADIIAFVHHDAEQHKFSEADIPPEIMPMMHHEHSEAGGGAAAHAEELGHMHETGEEHND